MPPRAPARARQRFYRSDLLSALEAAIRRLSAVVVLWQTSHVGEPWNEWADAATKAVAADELAVQAECGGFRAVRWPLARRSVAAWAAPLMRREVRARFGDPGGRAYLFPFF